MIELGIARGAKIGPIGRGSDWAKGEPAFRRWEAHFSTMGRHANGDPVAVKDGVKQVVLNIGVNPPDTQMFNGASYALHEGNDRTLQAWYWRNA